MEVAMGVTPTSRPSWAAVIGGRPDDSGAYASPAADAAHDE
jgi:hypothetical protein